MTANKWNRPALLASCSIALALLALAFAHTTLARDGSSVLLRLQQPGNLPIRSVKRFRGFVAFNVPHNWASRRRGAGDVVLTFTQAPGCQLRASVESLTTLSIASAVAQLRTGLPRASEPGQPEPLTVRTIAHAHGPQDLSASELVEPPPIAGAFTLYGATLVQISHGHWAGLQVGLEAPQTCRVAVLHDWSVVASLERLLKDIRLRDAQFN
jgi:hypothetical protein